MLDINFCDTEDMIVFSGFRSGDSVPRDRMSVVIKITLKSEILDGIVGGRH